MSKILETAYESFCDSIIDSIEKSSNKAIFENKNIKALSEIIIKELKKNVTNHKKFERLVHKSHELTSNFFNAQDASLYWVRPLIADFYRKAKISPDTRKILITDKKFGRYGDYSVVVDFTDGCKVNISPELDFSEKYDLFLMPQDSKFDIASMSLFGHEVGHVFFYENYPKYKTQIRNSVKDKIKNISYNRFEEFIVAYNLYKQRLKDSENIENIDVEFEDDDKSYLLERITRHAQEYICDEIGRVLLGPAFDFALIKLAFSANNNKEVSSSEYPATYLRIIYSLESIKEFLQKHSGSEIAKRVYQIYSEYFEEDESTKKIIDSFYYLKNNKLDPIDSLVLEAFESCRDYIHKDITSFDFNEVELHWNTVKTELDNMRPPFENVSDELPELLFPSTVLINSTLYYYSKEYIKDNSFFKHSQLQEKEKVLRDKLIEHLRYSISLYDFLIEIKKKMDDDLRDKKERGIQPKEIKLDETLWKFRNRGIKNNFIVVPTTDINYQYSSNAIDLRLGNIFITPKLTNHTDLPIIPELTDKDNLSLFYEKHYMKFGDVFTIHPHSFVLAQTLEYVCMPNDFYGMILGRSSWGRVGLTIATAVAVGPGFKGCITLEIRNLGETPLILKIGSRICQFVLIQNPVPDNNLEYSLSQSKYICPVSAEIPSLSRDRDWDILPKVSSPVK